MSLRDEFHAYLDEAWPLWSEPKNREGMLYAKLWAAFRAGFKIGDEGPTPSVLGYERGEPVSLLKAVTTRRQKFKPPRRRPR